MSFDFFSAVTIHSNFGAQENKICHPFHFFPTYLPWSDGTRFHDLCFLNVEVFFFFFLIIMVFFLNWRLITLQYCSGFCHTLTRINYGCTCVPYPEPPPTSLPIPSLWVIPVHQPWALSHALNLDWWSVSHMIIYMFQCYALRSSHPRPLPQSPIDCSIYLCLLHCPAYRVIITIFLNSIYMC